MIAPRKHEPNVSPERPATDIRKQKNRGLYRMREDGRPLGLRESLRELGQRRAFGRIASSNRKSLGLNY